ncbi:MAG: nucleotide exchange factor GrpE [Acidimicrobiales bacterium]|nr:nucleotide exchange factor GrpE [Acidimicrobiales bacterium]
MSDQVPGTESASWPGLAGQQDADSAPGTPHRSPYAAEANEEGIPASEVSEESVTEYDSLRRERDDYKDALQRLQADFENYKKRVVKQQEEVRERAAEHLVEQLLPVLDTADLALAHGGGEDVKQMASVLFDMLEREGLERIDNVGEPFDPSCHDAVAHEPVDDGGPQEVAEVMRSGYRWRGRVLRAAMVKVRG